MNFISAFLKDILDVIVGVVGNYGWAVVLFTLLIRLVLLPLDIKSKKSMKRMQAIQPQLDALQKKYAKDKEKLSVKMNELYRKEHISPFSGCLPMLIQLPILFCMFTAMRVVANEHTVQMLLDMMNGSFSAADMQGWLWVKNVFQPDSFMSTVVPAVGDKLQQIQAVAGTILSEENLATVREFLTTDAYRAIADSFGANSYLYEAPLLMWTIRIPAEFNGYFLLPLLAAVSQFISAKLTQTGPQTEQTQSTNKMMQWFFPIFSIWICATSTAAFSVYWVAINIIQIVQQYIVNMIFDKKDGAKPEEVIQP